MWIRMHDPSRKREPPFAGGVVRCAIYNALMQPGLQWWRSNSYFCVAIDARS